MKRNHLPLQDVYSRPGFLLKRAHQVAAGIFIEECGEFSMTPSQYGALCALRDFPGIDQIAMGRLIGLDRSTIGLVTRLLTDRGFIERVVNPEDKRRMSLKLSDAGARLLRDIAPAARRAQEAVLAGLPQAEHARFLALLRQFLDGHGEVLDAMSLLGARGVGRRLGAGRRPRAGRVAQARDARQRPARTAKRSRRATQSRG